MGDFFVQFTNVGPEHTAVFKSPLIQKKSAAQRQEDTRKTWQKIESGHHYIHILFWGGYQAERRHANE
jgi:hypothetical protein